MIKYVPQPVDSDLYNTILIELFPLETDLREHTHMEDKILIPKVKYMEKWILKQT